MVEYPKTVMSNYRAIAVDISFELIPIVFATRARVRCAIAPAHVSTGIFPSDKLSQILVGQAHRTNEYELIAPH